MSRPAVFFDRDDTLMVNVPYSGNPAEVEAFVEAAAALAELHAAGFLIFVVSNQSGVGRGLITREQVDSVNIELVRQLGHDHIHTFYHSYATPDDPYATDRKPSPELVLEAAKEHGVDLARSYFVGDRLSDVECGLAAGCKTALLTHEKSSRRDDVSDDDRVAMKKAHHVARDLAEVTRWILKTAGTTAPGSSPS
jgi:D-glycero-D-manno-heptose 1,7-bisphosphate phosphatase